jgi:hypothetical protein
LSRLEQEELDDNILQLIEHNKNAPFSAVFRDRTQMLGKIEHYRQEIKNNEETIKKFITARDTLYAHRDPNATLQGLTLENAEQLITLCKDIYNCLRGGIFDVYFEFSRTHDWSIDFVLKQAALAKTQRLKKK